MHLMPRKPIDFPHNPRAKIRNFCFWKKFCWVEANFVDETHNTYKNLSDQIEKNQVVTVRKKKRAGNCCLRGVLGLGSESAGKRGVCWTRRLALCASLVLPRPLIDSVFFLSGGHFQLDLAMSGSPTCSRRRLTWLDLIERARASPLGGGYLLMYLLPLCDKLFQDTMPIAVYKKRASGSPTLACFVGCAP
jgi:hypothetical protein